MKTYEIAENGQSILCLTCGTRSHNIHDVGMKYCGNCHRYHEQGLICDFCRSEDPLVQDYEAVSQLAGYLEDGRQVIDGANLWAACAACRDLIQAKRWDELVERGVDGIYACYAAFDIGPREQTRDTVIVTYQAVFGEAFMCVDGGDMSEDTLENRTYVAMRTGWGRWYIVKASRMALAWSGSQWVPIGGTVQICNFGTETAAHLYAREARLLRRD